MSVDFELWISNCKNYIYCAKSYETTSKKLMLDSEWLHFSKCQSKHQEVLEYFYFFTAQKTLYSMVTVRCMFNEKKSYSQVRMKEKGESTKAPFMIIDSKALSSKKVQRGNEHLSLRVNESYCFYKGSREWIGEFRAQTLRPNEVYPTQKCDQSCSS